MIHDFAKSPRANAAKSTHSPQVPVRVRRLPKGRWILAIVIATLIVGWRVAGFSRAPASDFVPGASESQEYENAMEQQEREAAQVEMQEASKSPQSSEQQRQIANLQAKLKQHPSAEPEFGFYDSLSGSAWSVPVQSGVYVTEEERKRSSNQRYMLQAASVRDFGEAQRIVQRLRQLGLQAFYSQGESGGWYRINVGPFDNLSKANKAEDILVSLRMMPMKKKI